MNSTVEINLGYERTKLNKTYIYLLIINILCIIAAVITFAFCFDKEYRWIVLLPIAYMAIKTVYHFIVQQFNCEFTGGLIYKAALGAIFIRFVITPVSIALTDKFYYPNVYTSKSSINFAVILMIFELLIIYTTIFLAVMYYSKKYGTNQNNAVEMPKKYFVLIIFVILGLAILLLVEPILIIPREFLVLSKNYTKVSLDKKYDGFYYTIADITKPLLFIIAFSGIHKIYDRSKSRIFVWLSFIVVVLFVGTYTGTKRWEIVFTGIIGMYLLKKTYNKLPKSLTLGFGLLLLISFISISLVKFSWIVSNSANPVKDIIIDMFGFFQYYFSGPGVVANSIEMKEVYGRYIGLKTFINDFTGCIPLISKIVDQSNRINAYFNRYYNLSNTPLIIPMIGIGYTYFPIFPPVFTAIFEWLAVKTDFKLKRSKSIEYKYLYLYFGFYLSMCVGFNTQIIFGKFLIPFLPLLVLFKLNEKICLENGGR